MERPIKERMIGAGILVLAGVIVIPWLLDGDSNGGTTTEQALVLPGIDTQNNETRTVMLEVPPQNPSRTATNRTQTLDTRVVKEIPAPSIAATSKTPKEVERIEPEVAELPPPEGAQIVEEVVDEIQEASAEVEAPQLETDPPATFTTALTPSASEEVEVEETVTPATPVAPVTTTQPAPPAQAEASEAWAVQVGAFASKENAERLAERLRNKKYAAFVMRNVVDGRVRFRVRVGPTAQRAQAELLAAALREDRQPAKVLSHP